jgi:hypothetical protein
VKARVIGGLVLLLAGGALPYAALSKTGAPWDFGDRLAVITESVGSVEVRTSSGEVRPSLERGDGLLQAEEFRVGALSRLGVVTPQRASVAFNDATRGSFDADALRIERGWVHAIVGATPLSVRIPVLETDLTLEQGEHVIVFDGAERLEVRVVKGVAKASVEGSPWAPGSAGSLLRIGRGESPVWGAPDGPLRCAAVCRRLGARVAVEGEARPGVQVFINGRLTFTDGEGKFTQSLPLSTSEKRVTIFDRDASGNVCRSLANCGG